MKTDGGRCSGDFGNVKVRQLSSAILLGCGKITDAAVVALASGCRQLSSLHRSGCGSITNAAMLAVVKGCPQLPSLNVHWGDVPDWPFSNTAFASSG